MANDLEMNEVNYPLLEKEPTKENDDERIPDVEIKSPKVPAEFTGLTKEELEKYANDPFWKKLRIILFVIFWLIWAGMLVAAILIVVMSPKCPKRPKLDFWEKKVGYWVDTMSFVDSDGNGVGDFDGLITRLDYIQKQLGAGYLVLDPIFAGQYSEKIIGAVHNFSDVDSSIGNKDSFIKLVKESRKRGIEIVLTVDFNSLHKSAAIFSSNPNATVKFITGTNSWLSRDGKTTTRQIKSKDVYSSSSTDSELIDLDLTSESVLKEIKESVKYWLSTGVRGFLLTNVAFYVENITAPTTYNPIVELAYVSGWYKTKSFNGQLFSAGTKDFLREIRTTMNEVATKTDKSRVLIVEAGNVGYGLFESNSTDHMLQYLNGQEKIVDMVVGREFLRNRGWNVDIKKYSTSSVNNYLRETPENQRNRVALVSATSTSIRTSNLLKLAAPFLLPGNPIIYFGSEIGIVCDVINISSTVFPFYPESRTFPLQGIVGELPMKCNHMIMPWDNNGYTFFNGHKNLTHSYITNTVDTVQIKTGSYEIFIREAEGFPKIIVALIEDDIDGKVFSFSSVCAKVTPLLVYPANPNLPENKEVDAMNIYLKIHRSESVHVFKCVP